MNSQSSDPTSVSGSFNEKQILELQAVERSALTAARDGRLAEAEALFRYVINSDSSRVGSHVNLATVLSAQGRFEPAIDCFDRALELAPAEVTAWFNRGNALARLAQHGQAIQSFERALALAPDDADIHWNLSLSLLALGEYRRGWQEYEWRWQAPGFLSSQPRLTSSPAWCGGAPLAGRTLLLHAEQGLGDTIQFARYASLAAQNGASVCLMVPQKLTRLLRGLKSEVSVVPDAGPLPPHDLQSSLMSMPLAFGTELETIPSARAYLVADPEQAKQWRARLGPYQRPRVGLMWRGAFNSRLPGRHVDPEALFQCMPADIDLVSLQKDLTVEDRSILRRWPAVAHFGDDQSDLADAAALVDAMDLVISIDTSIAHLAGALGKPVWILLSNPADWRWMLDRIDSPWYASARLYRQPTPGAWMPVLEQIGADLRIRFGRR